MRIHSRSGAALLVVLAVVASLSVTAMTARLGARDAQMLVSNRMAREVALWAARSCMAQGRSLVDGAMAISDPYEAETAWANLNLVLAQRQAYRFSPEHTCDLKLIPSGRRMDVNSASPEELARLFRNLGLSGALSDSLRDALVDWRDIDETPSPSGAEHSWYRSVQRPGPRNSDLLNDQELFHIRGFTSLPQGVQDALLEALGAEQGRMTLLHSDLVALSSLPGFGEEVVAALTSLRERARGTAMAAGLDLSLLREDLTPQARSQLDPHLPYLSDRIARLPDTWELRSTGFARSESGATIAVRLSVVLARSAYGTRVLAERIES